MFWTDEELEVMRYALDLLGDEMASSDRYGDGLERAHTSLSLRVAEELSRRDAIRRLQ